MSAGKGGHVLVVCPLCSCQLSELTVQSHYQEELQKFAAATPQRRSGMVNTRQQRQSEIFEDIITAMEITVRPRLSQIREARELRNLRKRRGFVQLPCPACGDMLSGDLALVNSHIEACLAKNRPEPVPDPVPAPAAKSLSAEENNEEPVEMLHVVVVEGDPAQPVQVQVPTERESDKAAHPFGAAQYTEADLLEGSGSFSSGSLGCPLAVLSILLLSLVSSTLRGA